MIQHEKKGVIIEKLKEKFTVKQEEIQNSSNDPEILACQAEIAKRLRRIHVKKPGQKTIGNESTVRYVYGDPIVDMIIDSFGYKLEIEETVGSKDESQVNLSSGSKTDYCCWRLYRSTGKTKSACITVLETKHEKNIRDKLMPRFLGIIVIIKKQ